MKKKKVLGLLIAVAVGACITACSGGSTDSTTAAKAADETTAAKTTAAPAETAAPVEAAASAEKVTLWYYWETEGHQRALDDMIVKYNAEQSNYAVTAKYVPFADFKKQLSIGASADELPDLVILDSPDHASYAAMGIFADITGKFNVSSYYDGPAASAEYEGALYGVPFGCNCLALYYNEDMLKAASVEVPTTWDELQKAASALATDSVSGLAFCSLQNEEGTFNFAPWLWSTGASSYEMNSDSAVRALTFVKGLVDSGAMSKECINWTQGDVMNQFISGNVAMMVNGPWQIPTMKEEAPGLNWDVALIPMDSQYASSIGGENYAVIAGGNEGGALDFLGFATQEEQVIFMMTQMGYISADKNIAANQFTDEADAVYKKFVEQMEYAQARGPLPEWPEVSDAISLAFNQVMTSAATPEDAAAEAQATIDTIIK